MIIGGVVREPIIVMKTAAAMSYAPQFLGISPTMDHRVVLGAGKEGEGFIAANFAQLYNSDVEGAKLYRELFENSGTDPKVMGMYNFYGFMTAMVLVEGLERAGKRLTRAGLIRAMEGIKDWGRKGCFSRHFLRSQRSCGGQNLLSSLQPGAEYSRSFRTGSNNVLLRRHGAVGKTSSTAPDLL